MKGIAWQNIVNKKLTLNLKQIYLLKNDGSYFGSRTEYE